MKYSVVVTAIKDRGAELGGTKMQCYFENAVEAVEFYQSLMSQPGVVYIGIRTTSDEADEEQA